METNSRLIKHNMNLLEGYGVAFRILGKFGDQGQDPKEFWNCGERN